jgi:hypothetical protein
MQLVVRPEHFEEAFKNVSPSGKQASLMYWLLCLCLFGKVSESDAKRYESMQRSLSKNRLQ